MNTPLEQEDAEIYNLIQQEKYRQYSGLELIASEVSFLFLFSTIDVCGKKHKDAHERKKNEGGEEINHPSATGRRNKGSVFSFTQ